MFLGRLLIFVAVLVTQSWAVKEYLFKKCSENGFCARNRFYAGKIADLAGGFDSPYRISEDSVQLIEANSTVVGDIYKHLGNGLAPVRLPFEIQFLERNAVRIKIDEDRSEFAKKHASTLKNLNWQRFKDADKYALAGENLASLQGASWDKSSNLVQVSYQKYTVEFQLNPFKITVLLNGTPQIVLNDRNLLNIEHLRTPDQNEQNLLKDLESDFNSFIDDFKDSKDDSIPFGPESIGIDVSLLGFKTCYGIPEHSNSLSLKDTQETDPYRLYNVDIFEYEVDSLLPMYGSIPFMVAHKPGMSAGIFWINGADTYVDIHKAGGDIKTHWFSENGVLDMVLIFDETPTQITKTYSHFTGNVQLPSLFSLGYHQCRWNYNDEDDVLSINSNMDKYQIPYDSIWLDIEYTDEKKYFTWKHSLFPDPDLMMKKLDRTARNLITIIDPHLKTGYSISNLVESKGLSIKDCKLNSFHGHCWPGESVWIDTFNPDAEALWSAFFANNTEFSGDATNLHIWNDMNEPSVFNGPETTSPKDLVTWNGYEIRSNHNIYGLTFHQATYDALMQRYNGSKRPFILTRAYFSGSQRSTAMWSGDNMSKWEYLKLSLPMLLTSQVVNMPFSGSDVGGFFGDPSNELLVRWYQTGIWYPFFRAHAHIDSKRREPWLLGEPYTSYIKSAVNLRYSLLPVFYTKFYESNLSGDLIIKPMFYENPNNEELFELEDQFFIDGLLVKPVTDENAESIRVLTPGVPNEIYYNYFDLTKQEIQNNTIELETNIETIPVFIKGGSILPRKDRYRRSTKLMKYDPYTLVIALDANEEAAGSLYVDDGETFSYKNSDDYLYLTFEFKNDSLSSKVVGGSYSGFNNKFEKLLITGYESKHVSSVTVGGEALNFEQKDGVVLIKNPKLFINDEFKLQIN